MNLKRILRKVEGLILAATLALGSTSINAKAAEYWPDGISVESYAAIIMEQETGTILFSQNIDEPLYPASITKVMTALVILENCELDETVVFSPLAVSQEQGGTSSIARDYYEEMSIEDTLYGMLLESANECAWALAEHCSGTVEEFSNLMNQKAEELGCTNTHFSNPNGLHSDDHYTSAHDMALIAREAYNNPKFQEIVGTKNYTIGVTNKHSEPTMLNNHHCMLHHYKTANYIYKYCMGGKTGFTTEARNTLVTYAKKDNMTLVCVVMKSNSTAQYTDTTALFDYCFDNFAMHNISENTSIASEGSASKTGSLSDSLELIKISSDGNIVLPKTASFSDAIANVTSYKNSRNPNVIGKISYTYGGREIGETDLIFARSEGISYPFDTLPVSEGGSGKEYYQVDVLQIVKAIVFIMIAIILLILLLIITIKLISKVRRKRFRDKKPKTNFKIIERREQRRRKRRGIF